MRDWRMYGDKPFNLIKDESHDAIVKRFVKLLNYLIVNEPDANWGQYLDHEKPKWNQIALAGQSQGGGMSEFLGQHEMVARVISFSGGWDYSAKGGKIANWYSKKNITPPDVWYGTYNVAEPTANVLLKTYQALLIPANHIYALNLPVREGKKAHTEGVGNPEYKSKWIEMLGKGN